MPLQGTADGGPTAVAQPTIAPSAAVGIADTPTKVPAEVIVPLTVATARVFEWTSLAASPYLWLGIVLMLSTIWGAANRSRPRRDGVPAAAQVSASATTMAAPLGADLGGADPLATARRAAAEAERAARDVLAASIASGTRGTTEEQEARDALAHELARREAEMEQLRARLRAADAAEARPVDPVGTPAPAPVAVAVPPAAAEAAPSVDTDQAVRVARARQLAAVETLRRERAEAERLQREARLAAMPSTLPRALAAAVLDLPEAAGYWGNVLIAAARLHGAIKSGSALRIDGHVDGACEAPVVMISQGAVITGVVAAEHVVVLGAVHGTIIGKTVTIAKSAVVEGDMYYQTLSLDQDAMCDVRFARLSADASPAAVAASLAASGAVRHAA
jgi:cytoskeletal protein CcmA (bactofilin family)